MKTAYELAMERLNKSAPSPKLTDEQRQQLAELDSMYAAKLAEREITGKAAIAKAVASGDAETLELLEKQLAADRRNLQAELDEKKERVRKSASSP